MTATVPAEHSGVDPRWPLIWGGAFAIALCLYAATAHRGPQWQDSGWQQIRIITGQLQHPFGLALTHPLQYYLGRFAIALSSGEPALAITLVSSVAGAIAVANLAATILLLTRWIPAAIVIPAAFMLSHTAWQLATHTESYTISAALLTAEWLALVVYLRSGRALLLPLMALANGLGIANHLLASLAIPLDIAVIIWAVRVRSLPRWSTVLAATFWLVGTLPYTLLVIARAFETGDLSGTLSSALFGTYRAAVLNIDLGLHSVLLPAAYVAYNFPGIVVPLAVWALLARSGDGNVLYWFLGGQLLVYGLFVIRYAVLDQYMFYLPVYALVTLLAGLGLAHAATALRRGRRVLIVAATVTALWTPIVYGLAARMLKNYRVFASQVGNKPYRDGYRSFFVPWGVGDESTTRLNEAVQTLAGDNGLVLVAGNMVKFGIQYAQLNGQIPARVELVEFEGSLSATGESEWRERIASALAAGRPVILVPRDRDDPQSGLRGATWERLGDIYRLVTVDATTLDTNRDSTNSRIARSCGAIERRRIARRFGHRTPSLQEPADDGRGRALDWVRRTREVPCAAISGTLET